MHNILVCDDDRDIVAALKIYLSGGEYRVFEAYNGAEAVEAVRKNDIHLVLMDIMMPELDGIAATAAIRRESNAPIILLTAKSESSDKVLGLNVGADDYITKPFDPVEVLARVKSQLRRYTLLRREAGDRAGARYLHRRRRDAQRGRQERDGGRRERFADAAGIQHPAAPYPVARTHLFEQPDLRAGVERKFPRRRNERGGTHPPPASEDRDQPLRAALPEGRVGPGV